jgi:hypothetical protein
LSHLLRSSVVSAYSRILSLFGQMSMCSTISLQPQLGHFLSGHSRPEYFPTWTLVPQKPVCCLDLHILYMLDLDVMARSRCSQSTSSNWSCRHFFVTARRPRAISLLAWNWTGWDRSLVILFPQITMAMSSHGNIWVGVIIYPVAMALWTAPFAVVLHMQLSC